MAKQWLNDKACEICGHKGWCGYDDTGVWHCMRMTQDVPGYKLKSSTKAGGTIYVPEGLVVVRSNAVPVQAATEPPRASVDTLDAVYRAMMFESRLSTAHYESLIARGFTKEDMVDISYASLGVDRSRAIRAAESAGDCRGVPGFYYDENGRMHLAGSSGIMIPVRNASGKIVAVTVRLDEPRDAKYLWLSSRKHGGPGSGCPVHFPYGCHVGPIWAVRVTEGQLKADLAYRISGMPTIGIAGTGSWKRSLKVLGDLGASVVRLAFDMDLQTNHHVSRSVYSLACAVLRAGHSLQLETWENEKGIDDALASGEKITVLGRTLAMEYLRNALKSSAAIEADKIEARKRQAETAGSGAG